MLRNLIFVVIVIAIALVSGCGGGGSPGTGGGSNNVQPGQYFEFFRSGGGWFDPLNFLQGDSGTVVLANYDGVGNRTVLSTNSWSTTAPPGAVNIAATSGTTASFTIVGTPVAEFKFQCFTLIAGVQTLFEQRARTPLSTPVVTGRVVELGLFSGLPGNTGVPHVEVDFFDGSGTLVGGARTMPNGTFSAIVPLTAVEVMLRSDTIKTSKYYRAVYFEASYYSPLDITCRIELDPLINGVNAMPASMGLPQVAGGPPPPPTGCP
jgi:hypothetical protein